MRKLGDWDLVHNSQEYKKNVQPFWVEKKIKDCGSYTCENCIDGDS